MGIECGAGVAVPFGQRAQAFMEALFGAGPKVCADFAGGVASEEDLGTGIVRKDERVKKCL